MQSYKKKNDGSHTDPVTMSFPRKRKSVYSIFDILKMSFSASRPYFVLGLFGKGYKYIFCNLLKEAPDLAKQAVLNHSYNTPPTMR